MYYIFAVGFEKQYDPDVIKHSELGELGERSWTKIVVKAEKRHEANKKVDDEASELEKYNLFLVFKKLLEVSENEPENIIDPRYDLYH